MQQRILECSPTFCHNSDCRIFTIQVEKDPLLHQTSGAARTGLVGAARTGLVNHFLIYDMAIKSRDNGGDTVVFIRIGSLQ